MDDRKIEPMGFNPSSTQYRFVILIFVSLLFISAGMDQLVNTKLRSQV